MLLRRTLVEVSPRLADVEVKRSPGRQGPAPPGPRGQVPALLTADGLIVTRVGVVVPAHDEEALLPACLAALGAAAARAPVPVSVVVVLDACTDGTLDAVRRADPAPFDRLVPIACRSRGVGAARAAGSQYLIGTRDPAGLWLATTDADSVVPSDWIIRQLGHARLGARAVIGTVQVADWSQHPPHVEPSYRLRYRARDGHRHVHGANMSMAATAYLAAGGFPAVRADEDVAMIRRLVRTCGQVVWAADLPVTTSARLDNRTDGGFAGYLAQLADGPCNRDRRGVPS
jgi:glycosyltransferase involved in cell wall biosynthesis